MTSFRTQSKQNLIDVESQSMYSVSGSSMAESPSEIILTESERKFLLLVQRGDVASAGRHLEENKNQPEEFDKDCLDPLGRSAVTIAIENENLLLLEALLQMNVKPKDALLHAISEEYVEGVEMLLRFEEENHKPGHPYSWETMSRETAKFTKDITPLVLAAHHNNYEILKMLLDRGASLPLPHDIKCGCDECLISTEEDSLRHSLSRINAYKALSSTSLIALSSKDPILTSFELSSELTRLIGLEHEFKDDYEKLNEIVRKFCSELLDQVRTRSELSTMLNYDSNGDTWIQGEHHSLERLKLAIKYSQKGFVAHANVQQLLGAIWYDGLPGFRRKSDAQKTLDIMKLALLFPVLSFSYIINPESQRGKFLKKPFVKFISHCSSYMFFLALLALASQRIEHVLIEWFGNEWLRELLEDWKQRERGSLPGFIEMLIVFYVFGLVWAEMMALCVDGLLEYLSDLWNIVDFITNTFFMTWIFLRVTSWIIVHRDLWYYHEWPWYPREEWDAFDPMLISEGCFGAAMIFSFLKLVNIFSVNPHLGPLQISLGRMTFDILKFFIIYALVLFAFGCGLNQLMWYYAELEMKTCYHLPGGLPDYENQKTACFIWRRFANLFETSQSLFWASFGLVDLENFELTGVGSFTRFWSLLLFGSYSLINVIVLLNLLIAMMSNSYQIISEKSDTEWKFARTRLWLSYFEDKNSVPPPFNLIPTLRGIKSLFQGRNVTSKGSLTQKSRKQTDFNHKNVMRLLVRRYITEQQRRADEKGVNEDDINELKQDLSTFRYELVDILKRNGWNTSMVTVDDPTVIGRKGRAIERKLMKGFNIGIVEGIVNEVVAEIKKSENIFGNLAKAFGKRTKTDWNTRSLRLSFTARDQIGSSETSLKRSVTSLKKRIQIENETLLNSLNPENIVEYNPNLKAFSPATRVAYAKFKLHTFKSDDERNKLNLLRQETKEESIEPIEDQEITENRSASKYTKRGSMQNSNFDSISIELETPHNKVVVDKAEIEMKKDNLLTKSGKKDEQTFANNISSIDCSKDLSGQTQIKKEDEVNVEKFKSEKQISEKNNILLSKKILLLTSSENPEQLKEQNHLMKSKTDAMYAKTDLNTSECTQVIVHRLEEPEINSISEILTKETENTETFEAINTVNVSQFKPTRMIKNTSVKFTKAPSTSTQITPTTFKIFTISSTELPKELSTPGDVRDYSLKSPAPQSMTQKNTEMESNPGLDPISLSKQLPAKTKKDMSKHFENRGKSKISGEYITGWI